MKTGLEKKFKEWVGREKRLVLINKFRIRRNVIKSKRKTLITK